MQFSRALLGGLLVMLAAMAGCGGGSGDPAKLVLQAKGSLEKGDHATAIVQLKNALQKSPDLGEARFLLGTSYLESNDPRSAESELRRAMELRFDPGKVLPKLGKALLLTGEFQKIIEEIKTEADASGVAHAEILTLRALAFASLRKVKEGQEALEQALGKQPDNAEALLAKARFLAAEKKFDEARNVLDKVLSASPRLADAWSLKGDIARAESNSEKALEAYQKVLEFSPRNAAARLNIASSHIAAEKFDEARKQLDEVRKIEPGNPMGSYLLALIEFRKGNHAAARDAIQPVLKVAPNHIPSARLAGAIEFALGAHVQAQAYLERVVERVPGDLYARRILISSFAKTNQLPRALDLLQAGLAKFPDDPSLLALAGEIHMQNNEFQKATQFFEKAAKLNPKSAGIRTELALSRLATGDSERAVADLESAGQLDAGKYQADVLLVMSHMRKSNFDQALKAVQELEKKQPENPLTFNLKAAVLLGKKDNAGARKQLERALELRPNYVPAATNLAQLDIQDKNPQAARRRLESIVEKEPGNAQALIALATLGPALGASVQDRIGWLQRAAKAGPGAVQPQLMLAGVHAQAGDFKQAIEAAQQAQARNPDNVEVLDALGGLQLRGGQKEQALLTYGKLVELQPSSPLALYRLAAAQMANSNPSAGATLRKALAIKPDFAEAQAALVEVEVRANRHSEALKVAQDMQKQSPAAAGGYMLEGDVYMAEKKYLQAAKAYEAAFAKGKSGSIVVRMHAAYAQAGNAAEGKARLTQWLKVMPDDAGTRLYAADASLKAGDYRDAIAQYEWLLGKQPDNLVVLNNLAWSYQQIKDKRAVETAERAYKLKPDNAAVADTLGWILVEQGNTSRGLELLRKAVATAPGSPEIRYHLAQAWIKAGEKSKAREELERLLTSETAFPARSEALALLKQLRN